jgi:hypothetical protein
MAAAARARVDDGDGAAARQARAARAGAPVAPRDLKPEERDPADSLIQWAVARDARSAAPFAAKAEAVAGWRAALLRAEVQEARGDKAQALAEFSAAAAATGADPRAISMHPFTGQRGLAFTATVQEVVALTTVEAVCPSIAVEGVVTIKTRQDVYAIAAHELIVEGVSTAVAVDAIIPVDE